MVARAADIRTKVSHWQIRDLPETHVLSLNVELLAAVTCGGYLAIGLRFDGDDVDACEGDGSTKPV